MLTVNEGEPNDKYTVDPLGLISVIDLGSGSFVNVVNLSQAAVATIDFTPYNFFSDTLQEVACASSGLAEDLEPEYITVTPGSQLAYVSMQENNAMAGVDLFPLGFKDHSVEGQRFDASNRDGMINIKSWPRGANDGGCVKGNISKLDKRRHFHFGFTPTTAPLTLPNRRDILHSLRASHPSQHALFRPSAAQQTRPLHHSGERIHETPTDHRGTSNGSGCLCNSGIHSSRTKPVWCDGRQSGGYLLGTQVPETAPYGVHVRGRQFGHRNRLP